MKKIINWTFGSVFRTFGRILAYISIGILVAFLFSKFDIKLNDILGIPIIKAAILEPWATSENRIRWDQQGTDTYSSWNSTPYTYTPSYPVDKVQFRLKATDGLSYENTYILQFGYKPTPQSITPIKVNIFTNINSVVYQEIVCSEFQYNSNGYNLVKCSFTPNEDISSSTWLYVEINLTSGYVTDIRPYMYGFEERKGTNAVITDTGNQIIINIEDQTEQIENAISNSTTNIIEGLKEQNMVCSVYNKSNIKNDNKYLNSNGSLGNNNSFGITDYIKIYDTKVTILQKLTYGGGANICYYDANYNLISCEGLLNKTELTIPNNTYYIRTTIWKDNNIPVIQVCQNGNQAINDNVTDLIHDINDTDTTNALNEFKAFFNLFNNNGHGLTSIISAPLNAINSMTSATCSPLVLPLPYMENKNITLPCMRSIYEEHFGNFILLYDTITFGIVSYWIILKLFKIIKEFKNPDDDGLEVVDL